ncbi:MAG TPA: carbon-nitrogen hydrolase family protein [Baekduia sp.]|nr:carbon-nitrogen hydrolase family protein [Baekduia sp.]
MPATKRVVAIQLRPKPFDVEGNLRHIADLVGEAVREHSPDMVFLPEVSAAPNLAHRHMHGVVRPFDGPALRTYRELARRHGCVVGGGALTVRGDDARNTYLVCEPDGEVHTHDKDQPSMWENNYYGPGTDDGVTSLADGTIGLVNGFEWIRARTAARLRGRVRLVAGGMCFPSYPQWAVTRRYFWRREHGSMLDLARETPGRMARVVGAPAVHPSLVGDVVMETPFARAVRWPTIMVGETIIAGRDGHILQRLGYEDGEGYVCADLPWEDARPLDPVPDRFWMTTLPFSTQAVWYACNAAGRASYLARKRHGSLPWQQAPAPPPAVAVNGNGAGPMTSEVGAGTHAPG